MKLDLHLWLGLCTLVGGGSLACKAKQQVLHPVILGEAGVETVDPRETLAPPWRGPLQLELENGALLHWLNEPGTAHIHVRLLLSTDLIASKIDGGILAVAADLLAHHCEATLQGVATRVELQHRAGRIELAISAAATDSAEILKALADSLAHAHDGAALLQRRQVLTRGRQDPDSGVLATGKVVAQLFQSLETHGRIDRRSLASTSRSRLERGAAALLDPHGAVIVVQAPLGAEALAAPLKQLSEQWRSRLRLRTHPETAMARLHPPPVPTARKTWIALGSADTPALDIARSEPAARRASLVIGRIVPTPDAKTRALARLAQRVIQEQLDVRLSISGDVAFFTLVVRLDAEPTDNIERALASLDELASAEQPRSRLQQATRLWLGARVVEASQAGDDWTSLWSESIDLASADSDIPKSLARDAALMLEATPAELLEFSQSWLRPAGGQPGWRWAASGLTQSMWKDLARVTEIK